jgi:tripartite-type tricarboxylate transporter receptor subunit TctC
MLVSYPAGGANDLVARLVATSLTDALGATVVVDNRSGAAGVTGAEAAAKSPPDGYTLYMMSSSQVLAQGSAL